MDADIRLNKLIRVRKALLAIAYQPAERVVTRARFSDQGTAVSFVHCRGGKCDPKVPVSAHSVQYEEKSLQKVLCLGFLIEFETNFVNETGIK